MRIPTFLMTSLCLVILLPLCLVQAQENQSQSSVARKLDEYGYGFGSGMKVGNDCDVDAHLDNFAYFLKEGSGSRGYMIFYRGRRKSPKYFAYNPEWQHSKLKIEWQFKDEQVVLVDGGYREEPMMELWIVPKGAEPPKPTPTVFPRKRKRS